MSRKNNDDIYILKVIASDYEARVRNRPYRLIAISGHVSLHDLAVTIIGSFDFDFDHLFGFYNNLRRWHKSTVGYENVADLGEPGKFPGTMDVLIKDVFTELKQKYLFLFDYGDEWHFIVQLKKVEKAKPDQAYPVLLESVGEVIQYGNFFEDDEEDDIDFE